MMTVSFILAAYQIEPYIEACLRSVLACMQDGDELIVVNDGSTDQTRPLTEALIKQHPRTRILDKPNGGLSSARNAGLRIATCEHVLFIDGDDVVIPEAILQARIELERQNPDILVTDYLEWLEDGLGPQQKSRRRSHIANLITEDPARHLKETFDDCIPCVWTRFMRRSLFNSLGEKPFPEWSMYDDLPTTPHIVAQARTMLYLPFPTILYRTRSGSLTTIRSKRSCTDMVDAALHAIRAGAQFDSYPDMITAKRRFFERKFTDAVKQGRDVPTADLVMYRKLTDALLTAHHYLGANQSKMGSSSLQAKFHRKTSSERHSKIALKFPLMYSIIQTAIAKHKKLKKRKHTRSTP